MLGLGWSSEMNEKRKQKSRLRMRQRQNWLNQRGDAKTSTDPDLEVWVGKIAVPLAAAFVGAYLGYIAKSEATDAEYIKLSLEILRQKPSETDMDTAIRQYAVDLLSNSSPVAMSEEAKTAILSQPIAASPNCYQPTGFVSDEHSLTAVGRTLSGVGADAASASLRTQSLMLLRDSMYRACENYRNGAISSDGYKALLERYQDSVAALLAIEQLTEKQPQKAE